MNIDLRQLGHWARVRFAARCVRRVLPLFERAWPDAGKRLADLRIAAELAFLSAEQCRPLEGLADAALAACQAAGATQRPHLADMPARPEEPPPANADDALVAFSAAKTAEMAARAALADPGQSAGPASEAYAFACDTLRAAGLSGLHELIEADYASEGRRPWWKFW